MKIKLYLTFKDQRDWIKFTGYNAGFKSHIYRLSHTQGEKYISRYDTRQRNVNIS